MTVNLAITLAAKGAKVALFDADLYGPSLPILLGLRELSPQVNERGEVLPIPKFGVHTLSAGFFFEESRSLLWRGPMLHKMLAKMLEESAWPPLDFLFIDLPPGTGDVPLSLSKLLSLDGALLVTTPEEVAIADVRRALDAFAHLNIPIGGIIENMASFQDPETGKLFYPFGKEKGKQLAREFHLPCLASLPLIEGIREGAEVGVPYAFSHAQKNPFSLLADNFLSLYTEGKGEM